MEDMRRGSGREWEDSVKNQIESVRVPNCMLKTIKWSRHCLHSTQVPQNPLYLDPSLIQSGLELPELLQVEMQKCLGVYLTPRELFSPGWTNVRYESPALLPLVGTNSERQFIVSGPVWLRTSLRLRLLSEMAPLTTFTSSPLLIPLLLCWFLLRALNKSLLNESWS